MTEQIKKQETIFTITVISSKDRAKNISASRRTWGFYFAFSDAEEVVFENQTDIFEHYYDHAVIEEFEEGTLSLGKKVQWYKANYPGDGQPPKITKIKEPKMFKGTCNFAMG